MILLTKSSLVILTVTLASLFAEATPAVGDRSVFDVTLIRGSQTVTGTVTYELTNFDKAKNTWTQTSTTDFNGQKQTQTESIQAKDLLDDSMIDTILTNCAARGGTPETVTSEAGEFQTCAIPIKNAVGSGRVWIAKLPFGLAKWNTQRRDGVQVTGIIKSFQHGTSTPE